MKVIFVDPSIERFIQRLEPRTFAKVLGTIRLLEKFGYELGMPYSKNLGRRLYELRIHSAQGIRIFYTYYQNSAVLLHGYVKKSQKLPRHVHEYARGRLALLDRL